MTNRIETLLNKLMNKLADIAGHPRTFIIIVLLAAGWLVAGRFIEYETWFDSMDVVIFLTTFFLLFVVQNSQNADTKAIQDKLDELLKATPGTDTSKEHEEKKLKDQDK